MGDEDVRKEENFVKTDQYIQSKKYNMGGYYNFCFCI